MTLQICVTMVGTVALSLLFGVPRVFYPRCGAIGGAGWTAYVPTTPGGYGPAGVFFIATAVVIFPSRPAAVRNRCPVIIFLVSGIFPPVPGVGTYWVAYYLVIEQPRPAVYTGYEAVKVAVVIVSGIVLVLELPQRMLRWAAKKGYYVWCPLLISSFLQDRNLNLDVSIFRCCLQWARGSYTHDFKRRS